ncbi:hypothetical protein QTO34_005272 [Cnephaeus nilssonii]|uniref:Uncharacterized protein n=1 Tax=Cnephaeus nilssonii TaxID=3371016 RepID=A0AA40HN20_CNENI|nr:hypothetical protein QTO34_005272 [Eptesicus nilssonii]
MVGSLTSKFEVEGAPGRVPSGRTVKAPVFAFMCLIPGNALHDSERNAGPTRAPALPGHTPRANIHEFAQLRQGAEVKGRGEGAGGRHRSDLGVQPVPRHLSRSGVRRFEKTEGPPAVRGDTRGGARRTGRTGPRTSRAGGGAKPPRPRARPEPASEGCPGASPGREAVGGGIQGRSPAAAPRRAMLVLRSGLTRALAARTWPPQVRGALTPPRRPRREGEGRLRAARDPRMRPPGSQPRPGPAHACILHRQPCSPLGAALEPQLLRARDS